MRSTEPQVNVKLSPDQLAKLVQLARETRRKRTDVVRRLLDLATVRAGELTLGGEMQSGEGDTDGR